MGKLKKLEAGSFYTYLTEGCRLCREGAKLVLFVTGKCDKNCFYCPISYEKRGKDIIYANERKVNSKGDVIKEIELMDAEGASITGGEPLLVLDRVIEYLKLFKEYDLHVHLYTSVAASKNVLKKLYQAGLDEIRFHPPLLLDAKKYEEPLIVAKKLGMEAGFEIPALKFCEEIVDIVNKADGFMNLNELEFSETNCENLLKRGFKAKEDSYGAIGSDEIAMEYAKAVDKFHYCTAKFKDSVQLRRRLMRMALNHPDFYEVTGDGTLICGLIRGERKLIGKLVEELKEKNIPFCIVDTHSIEVSADFAEECANELKMRGFDVRIIERYPTAKRIVVEEIPL